ncbi:MAG TPA: methyltransferase domain-containing protein [Paludibaculum sp.]
MNRSLSWLERCLAPSRPLRLLDVGCGECHEGESLIAAGVSLTGIDLDESAIASARIRLSTAKFVCGDAAAFKPSRESLFDVVLVRRPDLAAQPARWRTILASAPVWLTGRGCVVLTTPGPHEAHLGRRWLDEAGFAKTTLEPIEADGERFLVTAMGPEKTNVQQKSAIPEDVVVWEQDEEAPAPFCDPRTGMCSPAPAHNDVSKEKEHVRES